MVRTAAAVCMAVLAVSALAEEQATPDSALAPKPELLEKIAKLKANEACLLPAPTIVEQLGRFAEGWHQMKKYGPEGRDYSLKMPWMEDRKRAFFCGANHRSPHRLNDAWEYDLAANTWSLLYVPDYNDSGEITGYDQETLVLQDGFLRTKKGGPAHPAHTWWGITYDPNAKAIVWYCAWPPYRLKEKLGAVGAKAEDLYKGPPMWLFFPEKKQWEPLKTEGPWPPTAHFGAAMEYVSDLKKPVLFTGAAATALDLTARGWKASQNKGQSLPIETLVYHDTKRKLLVAHNGPVKDTKVCVTWTAKVENGDVQGWTRVSESEEAPMGHDARSLMYYDTHSGDGLLFENGTRAIWSFNPDEKKWTKLAPTGDKLTPEHKGRLISYYDPARNVYVVLGAGWVWCYRYKA
ncbi:MAG: hypothetical protein KIS92_21340 [Planctomycetota bacterium]|nr:hypothetical protein [Planctomycetota bacterium]